MESPHEPPPIIRELNYPRGVRPPLHRTLGIRIALSENGEGIAWIEIDKDVHWGATKVHGGVIPPLVDIAGAIAVAHTYPDAMKAIEGTVDMTVNYLKSAREGDLTATGRAIHRGRRVGVAEVDVTSRGELCAKALVTYILRASSSDPEPA